jgi:16S rRNA processing protein RimM
MSGGASRHAAGHEPSPQAALAEWLPFGVLRRPHGTRGEILLAPYNVSADRSWTNALPVRARWVKAERVFDLQVVASRPVKDGFLIRFASPSNREALADLVGGEVQLERHRLPALSNAEFYVEDVLGFEVWLANATRLGSVRGSFWNGAYDVMSVVADDGRETFVPVLPEFVLSVDAAARRVTVDLHE